MAPEIQPFEHSLDGPHLFEHIIQGNFQHFGKLTSFHKIIMAFLTLKTNTSTKIMPITNSNINGFLKTNFEYHYFLIFELYSNIEVLCPSPSVCLHFLYSDVKRC